MRNSSVTINNKKNFLIVYRAFRELPESITTIYACQYIFYLLNSIRYKMFPVFAPLGMSFK